MTASCSFPKAVKQPKIITCFAGGMRCFSWKALFGLCQMSLLLLQPEQNSIFNSFVWSTLFHKGWSLSKWPLSNCTHVLMFPLSPGTPSIRVKSASDGGHVHLNTNNCERYLQTQQIRGFLEACFCKECSFGLTVFWHWFQICAIWWFIENNLKILLNPFPDSEIWNNLFRLWHDTPHLNTKENIVCLRFKKAGSACLSQKTLLPLASNLHQCASPRDWYAQFNLCANIMTRDCDTKLIMQTVFKEPLLCILACFSLSKQKHYTSHSIVGESSL